MAFDFPTKLFKDIKESVELLAPAVDPDEFMYIMDAGETLETTFPDSARMLVFMKGGHTSGETIRITFKLGFGGSYYTWEDAEGNAIQYSIAGNGQGVFGPVEIPIRGGDIQIEEDQASTPAVETFTQVKSTLYPEHSDVLAVATDTDGNLILVDHSLYVYKVDPSDDSLLWSLQLSSDYTAPDMGGGDTLKIDTDSSGNIYIALPPSATGSYAGIMKISSEGVLLFDEKIAGATFASQCAEQDGMVYLVYYTTTYRMMNLSASNLEAPTEGSFDVITEFDAYNLEVNENGIYTQHYGNVSRYTFAGVYIGYTDTFVDSVYWITTDPTNGDIVVSGGDPDSSLAQCARVSKNGVLIEETEIDITARGDSLEAWGRYAYCDMLGNIWLTTFNWGGDAHPIYYLKGRTSPDISLVTDSELEDRAFYYPIAGYQNKIYTSNRDQMYMSYERDSTLKLIFVEV